jgi:hypothetical protein
MVIKLCLHFTMLLVIRYPRFHVVTAVQPFDLANCGAHPIIAEQDPV